MLSRLVKATPVISNNFLRAFADAPKGAQAPPPPPPPDPDNTPIIAANNDNVDPEIAKFNFNKKPDNVDCDAAMNYKEGYKTRKAIIYKYDEVIQPTGRHSKPWYIKWETNTSNVFTENMMGWPTSGDIYAADQLKFTSKENAISFCKRYNYPFEVEEPTEPSPYLFKVFGDRVLKRTVVAEMKEKGPYNARFMWKYERPYEDKWLNRKHSDYGDKKWSDADSI